MQKLSDQPAILWATKKAARCARACKHMTDMLPDLRFDATRPLATQFKCTDGRQADLVLEIGFGGGEHLAGLAEANPAVNFIGAEPFCEV